MLTVGIARVGNDPELRFTSDAKPVMDLSLAFSFGKRDAEGKQQTQWVKASMFGARADKLIPYIKKGNQIYVELTDLHLDTYTKKDGGQGSSLKAMIQNVQFIGSRNQEEQPKPQATENIDPLTGLIDDVPF